MIHISLFLVALVESCETGCDQSMLGNGFCDLSCMTASCEFDRNDCKVECESLSCLKSKPDMKCDSECFHKECGFDFGDCIDCSTGCTQELLSNSVCDPACNNEACGFDIQECLCAPDCFPDMLLNDICDLPCNNSFCGYDNEVCFCSPGCSPSLYNNSDCDPICNVSSCNWDNQSCFCSEGCNPSIIGNQVCDADCNNSQCFWDGSDCDCVLGCSPEMINNLFCDQACNVSDCSFDGYDCNCNNGCSRDMLYNGICDSSCNVSECYYDGNDCNCNLGCTPGMVGDYNCDASCYVNSCFYDNGDCDCSPGCTIDLLENEACDSVCNNLPCEYDMKMCGWCASRCFEDMLENSICNFECLKSNCLYDYIDCADIFYYWPNSGLYAKSNTEYIYKTSQTAYFEFASRSYSSIVYMLGGDFRFVNKFDIFQNLNLKLLNIEPLYCSKLLVDGCYQDGIKPVFYVYNGNYFNVSMALIIKNITFTTFHKFSSYDASEYCQFIYQSGYLYLNDRHEKVIKEFLNETICSKSEKINYFDINSPSNISFIDVNFENIRYRYNSIINIQNGSVSLINVAFKNIATSKKSAVIQTPSKNCKLNQMTNSFSYLGGNVSFINNGFEIISENPLASFLSLCNIKTIKLKDINFSMNIFSGENSKLLKISRFFSLELKGLSIKYHLSNTSIIFIDQTELSDIIKFKPHSLYIQDILFRNISISNTVSTNLIDINYLSSSQSISIVDSNFENNDLITSAIKYSISNLNATCVDDELSLTQFLDLKNLKFIKNLSKNLISLENVENLKIESLDFIENNNNIPNIESLILKNIKNNSGYIKNYFKRRSFEGYDCLISAKNSHYLAINFSNFSNNNYCLARILETYCKVLFSSSVISDNDSIKEKFLFYFERPTRQNLIYSELYSYNFENLTFINNKLSKDSKGIVTITKFQDSSVNIIEVIFISSDQAFYFDEVKNIYIKRLFIVNSTSSTYAFLLYYPMIDSNISINDCIIFNSTSTILSINATELVEISFELENVQFIENNADILVVVDRAIFLKHSSQMKNSLVEYNFGLFMLLLSSGKFSYYFSIFNNNENSETVVLLVEGNMDFKIGSCEITNNTGVSLFNIENSKNSSVFESFNNTFAYNKAGAVRVSNTLYKDSFSVFAYNSYISGTILYSTINSTSIFKNSQFTRNKATFDGNIVNILYSILYLFNLTIIENSSKGKGGLLYNGQNSTFSIFDSNFIGNSANQGSCIYSHYSSNYNSIKNCSFRSNSADTSGCISLFMSSLTLNSSLFADNIGLTYSVIDLSYLSSIQIENSEFDNSYGSGGFIHIGSKSQALMYSSRFIESATNNSYSFFNILESQLQCHECTFISGYSRDLGSIYCYNS